MARTAMATSRLPGWMACGLLLAVPGLARAQGAATQSPRSHPVEVSPFVSSGVNDSVGFGAAVRWPFAAKFAIEGEAEFRHTDANPYRGATKNDGFNGSLNLVFDLPSAGPVTPYLVGGGGLEHYALSGTGLVADPGIPRKGTSFVVNMGGGVRVPITDRWGVRAELRWSDGWAEGAPESVRVFYGATVAVGKRNAVRAQSRPGVR